MTSGQLQEFIKANEEVTEKAVGKYVNGKIDDLNRKFDVYIDDDMRWKKGVDEYMAEMKPVKDGLQTVQKLNTFLKWLGLPALGALVASYFLIR